VKLGVTEFCPWRPDLVVSGINGGLNAGINVLYSGTVAAAIEGAFFDITSIAVSLEFDEHARFRQAARLARGVIEQIMELKAAGPQLFNLNIPTAALQQPAQLRVVPMGLSRYGEEFERRVDPRGRKYYWMVGNIKPLPPEPETDLTALSQGHVTLTPLDFNLTKHDDLAAMQQWRVELPRD
jgi:5'-nucleotidase